MHTFSSVAVAALLASNVVAAPAPAPQIVDKTSFTVPRVHNANHVRNGQKALAKAYRKYSWPQIVWEPSGGDSPWSWGSGFGSSSGLGSLGSGSGSSSGASSFPASYPAATPTSLVSIPVPASTSAVAQASSAESNDAAAAASSSVAAAPAGSTGATSGQTGTVVATSEEGGAEYVCPVTIGTTENGAKAQTLNLDFDTGSADLWVYSPQAAAQGGQGSFDSSKSSTFSTLSGQSFDISYGDGSSAQGDVGTDKVVVGGATVTKQAVEIATSVSAQFAEDASNDGLLGLAFSTGNQVRPNPQKTFFSNIQSQLAEPVFTVYLNESGEGEYEFGNIDSSKHSGDINYVPVSTEQGYWQFTSTSYQINGVTATNANANPAIADTGTSLALVDDAVASAYYAQIPGSKNTKPTDADSNTQQVGWTYPCDADIPSFGLAIGTTGYYVTVPPASIEYERLSGGMCFGGIQSNTEQADVPLQILGDVVLRNAFVVFDGGKTQLGWANKP